MAHEIHADIIAGISDLKINPKVISRLAEGFTWQFSIATSRFSCVPERAYEAPLEHMEDLEFNAIADAREADPFSKA